MKNNLDVIELNNVNDATSILYTGQCEKIIKKMKNESIDVCVTSPPYYQKRIYKNINAIGNEKNVNLYINKLARIFMQVKRVLKKDGLIFINIADTYVQTTNNQCLKQKNLYLIPYKLANKLQSGGLILRNIIVWNVTNKLPESVKDRFSNRYEYILMFSKSKKYYFDLDNIRVKQKKRCEHKKKDNFYKDFYSEKSMMNTGYKPNPIGKNPGNIWNIGNERNTFNHQAVFPKKLVEQCLKPIATKQKSTVLDPFSGTGTTGVVANKLNMNYIGIEISKIYNRYATQNIKNGK